MAFADSCDHCGESYCGGNGKTPVVIWLVEQLQQRGYRVGVVSRGYGGKSAVYPLLLSDNTTTAQAGDEPVLIFQRTGAPVAVSPKRAEAIKALLQSHAVDFIITDDGLQHYALQRDFELVVIDGVRRFGNGWWLPAGLSREQEGRLRSVDAAITNGGLAAEGRSLCNWLRGRPSIWLRGSANLWNSYSMSLLWPELAILLVFATLNLLGIKPENEHAFADHQDYSLAQLSRLTSGPQILVMTEKDAVKCRAFALPNWWYLPVDAQLPSDRADELLLNIQALSPGTK